MAKPNRKPHNKDSFKEKNLKTNSYRFDQFRIGAPDAESDKNLDKVFVDTGTLYILNNMDDERCIIVGGTGSGKTALLKTIETTADNKKRLNPDALSLKYLSNSTFIEYLLTIKTNLTLFYKTLWRHILIIELLEMRFKNEQQKSNFITWAKSKIDQDTRLYQAARVKALRYIDENQSFWQESEQRIAKITQKFEEDVRAELNVPVGVKLNGGVLSSNVSEYDIKTKAEYVIQEKVSKDLYDLIQVSKDYIFTNTQQKHFIIIDDLDKEWADPQIVYDLIASLIEVIKEFREFESCKVVISLRRNLEQLIFSGLHHRGGQREKFSSMYIYMQWEQEELKMMIEKRIKNFIPKKVYQQLFRDIPASSTSNKNQQNYFDYMIDRSYYRPREVIMFVNSVFQRGNEAVKKGKHPVLFAESDYSELRFHALEDEWAENYGEIRLLGQVFISKYDGFKFLNVTEEDFAALYLDPEMTSRFKGKLYDIFTKWRENHLKFENFKREFFKICFQIGIIGLKLSPTDPVQYFYHSPIISDSIKLNNETKIYIHKALHKALNIQLKAFG